MAVMDRRWSEEQIRKALADLPGWRYEEGRIEKVFPFKVYADAAAFAGRIFLLAEQLGHHPDAVCVMPGKVGVSFSTHEVKGVTEQDVKAAVMVNIIYERFAS